MDFINPQVYAAACRQKVSDSVWCRDFATLGRFFPLIYLHFICRPTARSSSAALWRAGGVFSSLTNVLQIARRMSMGEHLNLGHTLPLQSYCKWFYSPFFTFFSAVLPDWFGQIKKKKEPLTCFQRGFCFWILRIEHGGRQRLRFYPSTFYPSSSYEKGWISTRDHFLFCHSSLFFFVTCANTHHWMGGGCHCCAQLEVTQHAVVQ